MTEHTAGCLLCGSQLEYFPSTKPARCSYCGEEFDTNVACARGHFVCDRCHSLTATDLIERYCIATTEPDPMRQALNIMGNPVVKMHGPEHHFLVAAVLVSALLNTQGGEGRKQDLVPRARARAEDVKGGFCGFHGTCGAAMGAGIACSMITGATPLSRDEWRLSNLITATCLTAIANTGGPRCCKRDVFLALQESVAFLNSHLNARLPVPERPSCTFHHLNGECLGSACGFHPSSLGPGTLL